MVDNKEHKITEAKDFRCPFPGCGHFEVHIGASIEDNKTICVCKACKREFIVNKKRM